MSSNLTPPFTLEVFVRSLGPPDTNPKRGDILERTTRLADTERVAEHSVYIVGRTICPATATMTEPGRKICQRVAAFREWANSTGVSVDAIGKPRTVCSAFTGEEHEVIVFPTVVIAAFVEDRLWAVAPCTDGATTYSVTDLLDTLEQGRPAEPFPPAGRSPPGRRGVGPGERALDDRNRRVRPPEGHQSKDETQKEPTLR